MKPERAPAHSAPVTTQHTTHAAPAAEPRSEFAALLSGAVGGVAVQPAEPSPLDALLAGPLASGKRRRLVICSQCGSPTCFYSYYVDG